MVRKALSLLFACLCATSVSAHAAGVRPAAELIADAVGEHRLVLLGEMHGTREVPLLTSMLVAHYARTEPVLLGLEVDASDQPLVDAFLESAGTDSDFAEVLSGAHWREPTHDGRDSVAMLGLLEHVRRLRAQRADVAVVLFDAPGDGERDQRMAEALRTAMRAHPGARTLVLTGNVHAVTGERPALILPDGTPYDAPTTLGRHLLDLAPLSIDIQAAKGEFWACRQTCGPLTVSAPGRPLAQTPELRVAGGSWDLRLWLPAFSASPPAVPTSRATGNTR